MVAWWLVWVFSRCPSLLWKSKNMYVRLTGDSKVLIEVNVSVRGSLLICGPAIDWWPVYGAQRELGHALVDPWDPKQE